MRRLADPIEPISSHVQIENNSLIFLNRQNYNLFESLINPLSVHEFIYRIIHRVWKFKRLSISFCIRKRNLRISWMNKKREKLKFSIHIFLVQPLSSKRSSIIFRWSLWLKLPLWSLHASGSRCRNGASRFFFFLFNR